MLRPPLLYLNVLVVATCGLVYELLAGTLASYVLGDSVTQFSMIIGVYLTSMGVGAWLSGMLKGGLGRRFVDVELGVALIGGLSAPILFLSFAYLSWFRLALFAVVAMIGVLVGLELPLLMRILKENVAFDKLVSRVLTFDYLGALVASLLFPIVLVPHLGLVRTSILFGAANAGVALWGTYLLRPLIKGGVGAMRGRAAVVLIILCVAFIKAETLTSLAEEGMFDDSIVYTQQTRYQRIVVTRSATGFKLYLNGNLQFSSDDEYRYHEALVHPAASLVGMPRRVLVLGGGDGLAVRELLRYPSIESVTLVDLDASMTHMGRTLPWLVALNHGSLNDPRVHVINEDAMVWLAERDTGAPFDLAIVDFPDPNTFSLGKLYTRRFYRLLKQHLGPESAVAVQATSPLYSRRSFWCVVRTIEAAGFAARGYQATVPSFGIWGFVLARRTPFELPTQLPTGLRFLTVDTLPSLFAFPADLGPIDVDINTLNDQQLVRYYENEWRRWE